MHFPFSKKSRNRRISSASSTPSHTTPSHTTSSHTTSSSQPSSSSSHPPLSISSSPPNTMSAAPVSSSHHHRAEPTTLVESLLETTSIKLADGTQYALSAITLSDIIDNYISPVIRYFHALYKQQPEWSVVRLGMIGVLVASGLPIVGLAVGVGMACIGCFLVCGSALFVIEASCLAFIGCVLAPVGLLAALTIGCPSLFLYGLYSLVYFLSSF